MKNYIFKIYLFTFFLISDYAMFAQPGSGGGSPGNGSGDDDGNNEGGNPDAPINGKTIVLAITAISFAYYYFSKKREEKQYLK